MSTALAPSLPTSDTTPEDFAAFGALPDYGSYLPPVKGQTYEATVLKSDGECFVCIGSAEAVIASEEVTRLLAADPCALDPGRTLTVLITQAESLDFGLPLASATEAVSVVALADLSLALRHGTVLPGRIIGMRKAGVAVEVCGRECFMPLSHMGARAEKGVGRRIPVCVVDINEDTGNVAVSRKRALVEQSEYLRTLRPGDRLTAEVSGLAPFGAFCHTAQEVVGLIHVSELDWREVSDPSAVLSIGELVEVEVVEAAPKKHRLKLSRKRLLTPPDEQAWMSASVSLTPGTVVSGTVKNLTAFGAFVRIEHAGCELDGLVHISQLSDQHVESPGDVVSVGQQVAARVLSVSAQERKLSLSLRAPGSKKQGRRS